MQIKTNEIRPSGCDARERLLCNYWLCESFIGNARTFPTWSSSLCHCLRVIYLSTWVLALNANNKIADFLVFLATIHKDFVLRKERYDFPQSSKTERLWNSAPYLQEHYWYKSCGCLEKSLQIKLLALLSPKKFGYNKSKADRELHGVGVFCFGSCCFLFFTFSSNRRTWPIHAVTVVHWINHYPLDDAITSDRAVFKWLSKLITSLRLLRLVIGLKDSRQFFNQWDAKPKPIAPCTRDFSALRASYR